MKKAYTKPALFAETFQMAEHIASGCMTISSFQAMQNTAWTCAISVGGEVAFTTSLDACGENGGVQYDTEVLKDHDFMSTLEINSQCYTTTNGGPMFSS